MWLEIQKAQMTSVLPVKTVNVKRKSESVDFSVLNAQSEVDVRLSLRERADIRRSAQFLEFLENVSFSDSNVIMMMTNRLPSVERLFRERVRFRVMLM